MLICRGAVICPACWRGSVIRRAKTDAHASAPWVRALLERRPARVVTIAMANKTARIVWAVLTRGEVYRPVALA